MHLQACRGGNSSKAAVRKVSKQVALAFIKRTLARYHKYQDTGISSFADPSLVDILFSPLTDAKSGDCVGSGTASNTLNDASNNNQQEARGSGKSLYGLMDIDVIKTQGAPNIVFVTNAR